MFKKINKKGFTLAELLIVVAIIGVLVAISIPIFTAQLKKAKLATNQANARAAYAAAVAQRLGEDEAGTAKSYKYVVSTAKLDGTGTGSTSLTKGPTDWTIDTDDGVLGKATATEWYIAFAADDTVTYTCTMPGTTTTNP